MLNLYTYTYIKIFGQAPTTCNPFDGSNGFLGFPHWNHYLAEKGYYIVKEVPGGEAECRLRSDITSGDFNFGDFWYIGVAVIEMIMQLAALIAIAMIIWGGFKFITSQGSPDKIASARNTVLYASIGLFVAVAARAIISFLMARFA